MAVVVGGKNFLKNLNKAIEDIKGRTKEGMLAAALLVESESREKTPVDEGNLKGGHYTAPFGTKDKPMVQIGTTADYSVYVHEDLDARHTTGEAKFLEKAVNENKDKILKIVRDRAKV